MHSFFFFLLFSRAHQEEVICIDAIPNRTSVANEEALSQRCKDLFNVRNRTVVVRTHDGLSHWHIRSMAALLHMYRQTAITAVLSIPEKTLRTVIPERW